MKIQSLNWDEYRIEHIAIHNVTPEQVWEACCDLLHIARKISNQRYLIYGQAYSGRYLFIVIEKETETEYKPITARDMTDNERKNFRKIRK